MNMQLPLHRISPVLMVLIYCWLVVLSAFQTIKKSQRKASATTTFRRVTLPTSSSMFSVSSLKDGIQRVIGCTPPPPYEVGLCTYNFGHILFRKMCLICAFVFIRRCPVYYWSINSLRSSFLTVLAAWGRRENRKNISLRGGLLKAFLR